MAEIKLSLLPPLLTEQNIIVELSRLLALAMEGKVTGYFVFYRTPEGMEMSRDGFTDVEAAFATDILKQRLLKGYA